MKGAGLVKFAVDCTYKKDFAVCYHCRETLRCHEVNVTSENATETIICLFMNAYNTGTTDEVRYCMRLQFGNN